jgi:hypothetical protein
VNPSRLTTILLLVALMPALSCVAQQIGAPSPETTAGDQLGPGSPQIPITPSTTSPERQETSEAIPEITPGRPSAAPFTPLEPEPEHGTTSGSSQSDFRSTIEQDPGPNKLDR